MIKTQTNKNLIFLFSILNYYKDTSLYHPLAIELLSDLNFYQNSAFKELTQKFINKQIPQHPYQYALLSVHINNDLKPKTQDSNAGFGPKTYKMYTKELEYLLKEIYETSNFNSIYKTNIAKKYKEITDKISKNFKGNIYKNIIEFWNPKSELNLNFVPNFLSVGHSFGVHRRNNIYSITSPVNRDRKTEFANQNMISNSIHEFSHSIFQKLIIDDKKYKTHQNLCKEYKIPESLQKRHPNTAIYIEETLIRVSTLVIQEKIFKDFMTNEETEKKREQTLSRIENQGYILARDIFKVVENSNNVVEDYLKFLGN